MVIRMAHLAGKMLARSRSGNWSILLTFAHSEACEPKPSSPENLGTYQADPSSATPRVGLIRRSVLAYVQVKLLLS
jgi:hypothetical protein